MLCFHLASSMVGRLPSGVLLVSLSVAPLMLFLSEHASLAAEPAPLLLEVQGNCPSVESLQARLASSLSQQEQRQARGHRLEVDSLPSGDGVDIRLRASNNALVLTRRFKSRDCAALSEVIALILQAHFAPLARPAPPHPWQLWLGLSGGFDLLLDPVLAGGLGQLEIGLLFAGGPFLTRLVIAGGGPTDQTNQSETTQRVPFLFRLDGGLRWDRGRLSLQPTLGLGVSLAYVVASDLPGRPSTLRVSPVLATAFATLFRISRRWAARGELTAHYFIIRDSYVIRGAGEVARSPTAELVIALGIQYDIPL